MLKRNKQQQQKTEERKKKCATWEILVVTENYEP